MKNAWDYLEPGREMKYYDLCVGVNTDNVVCVYARHRPVTKATPKRFVPSIRALNDEIGMFLRLRFMRRHDLPGTLVSNAGELITRGQLDNVIYVLDTDTGLYYHAEPYPRMRMRESRRHFLAWKRVANPLVPTLDQRVIQSITLVSRAALNKFKVWYEELLQAEEAIRVLEPNILRERAGYKMLLNSDFRTMIKEAYLDNKPPAALLADVSNRNYTIPDAPLCEVGTQVRYSSWLQEA